MAGPLYLDTSAVLRACLEAGTTADVELRIREAPALITSRVALVESARALFRVRTIERVPEARLADVERQVDTIWAHCDVWEVTSAVCDLAKTIAPGKVLRTLDVLHLATFVLARRRIEGLELLSTDDRLNEAAGLV